MLGCYCAAEAGVNVNNGPRVLKTMLSKALPLPEYQSSCSRTSTAPALATWLPNLLVPSVFK